MTLVRRMRGFGVRRRICFILNLQPTCFIVFLIRLTVVFSDTSSMSSWAGSGSFGPMSGSLLLGTSVSEGSAASAILRFLLSKCMVRGTNLTAGGWFEASLCSVSLSLWEEVWLELEPCSGCWFMSMMALCNVPILSSVGLVPCWFVCLW